MVSFYCCKGVILTDLNMVHGTVGNLSIHLPFHNLSELLVAGASWILMRHDSCPSLVAVTLAPQTLLFVRFDDFFANPGAVFGLFLSALVVVVLVFATSAVRFRA